MSNTRDREIAELMPSYARLFVSARPVESGVGTWLIETNNSGSEARDVRLSLSADGVELDALLSSRLPRRIAAKDRVELMLSTAPGPTDMDVVLSWLDRAGIPGQWRRTVRRVVQ